MDPFFISENNIGLDDVYSRGATFQFKQKFYHQDRKLGMWYFGHLLAYSNLTHSVKTLDENFEATSGDLKENRYYYGLLIGSRWMQRFADSGFTVDAYAGIGFGSRSFAQKYVPSNELDAQFSDTIKKQSYFPILIGLNIGLIGPKRRLTK